MHLCLGNFGRSAYYLSALLIVLFAFSGYSRAEDIDEIDIDKEMTNETINAPAPEVTTEQTDIEQPLPVTEQKTETIEEKPTTDATNKFADPVLTYSKDVEVEKSVYLDSPVNKSCDCKYTYLAPYTQRRSTFGFLLGVGFSQYQPTDYKPDFVVNQTFEDYYGYPEGSLGELQLGLKWNMGLGSFTLEGAGGYYFNQGKYDSTLKIIPVRLGIIWALDNLSNDPWIVPYGFGGAYEAIYEERLASQAVGGNTGPAPYFGGGLMFSINGLDEDAAIRSYDEMGLEHTYVFVEGRMFMKPSSGPDTGSALHAAAGLKLEY